MTTKRTVTVTIGDQVTITIDESIPLVPTEHATPEERCTLCKIKPSDGTGRCFDRDCKRLANEARASNPSFGTLVDLSEMFIDPDISAKSGRTVQTLDELRARLHGGDAS